MAITSVLPPGSPSGHFLEQNFPNPFNPTTVIRYSVAERTHVSVSVFTGLGQLVAKLVDCEQDVGMHEVIFDGSGLSPGAYYCRCTARGTAATKILLLIK
jgi:hypothetical protein